MIQETIFLGAAKQDYLYTKFYKWAWNSQLTTLFESATKFFSNESSNSLVTSLDNDPYLEEYYSLDNGYWQELPIETCRIEEIIEADRDMYYVSWEFHVLYTRN